MIPVTLAYLTLAADLRRFQALPASRPALRRADQPDTAFVVTRNHRGHRMAKTVSVTGLRQRQRWLHRVQESRA